MTQNMNLALGINFDLLKTNLAAMYEKDSTGSRILLLPTAVNSPNPVTLDEMIKDFKNAFGMTEEDSQKISGSLDSVKKEGSSFNINKITFQLQAAFLYKEMPAPAKAEGEKANNDPAANLPTQEESGNNDPKENNKGKTEYAFAISVNMADALPDFGFVKLNSLFVAVWNTERESVLKQIGTGNITRMLQQLDVN